MHEKIKTHRTTALCYLHTPNHFFLTIAAMAALPPLLNSSALRFTNKLDAATALEEELEAEADELAAGPPVGKLDG